MTLHRVQRLASPLSSLIVPISYRLITPRPLYLVSRRYATSRAPETDKSRILEKPTRFNPPSHGSRRVRPRAYPGPRLSEEQLERQKTKRYPNMMPPEGSFMYSFLTDRRLHLWITLSTLTALAAFAWGMSFLQTTIYRDQLPSWSELFSRPFSSVIQFVQVYKLHVAHESEVVAQKRRRKLEDVQKRKEFLREHGVEPGFLTGSWMDRFGTVESDKAKELEKAKQEANADIQSPAAMEAVYPGSRTESGEGSGPEVQSGGEGPGRREKKKVKMWLGIW